MGDDTVGAMIPPHDLSRVVGDKFVSEGQMAEMSGLLPDTITKVLGVLVEGGLFELWVAAKCPSCTYVWPVQRDQDEFRDFPSEIFCPLCNATNSSAFIDFYEVYRILKSLD